MLSITKTIGIALDGGTSLLRFWEDEVYRNTLLGSTDLLG